MTFLSRAAELSEDEGQHARRLLAAAEAALTAGQPQRAGALLEQATPELGDPLARAQARRLRGTMRLALGQAGEVPSILLEAARALAPADPPSCEAPLKSPVGLSPHPTAASTHARLSSWVYRRSSTCTGPVCP